MNNVQLIGNLTHQPEARTTSSETAVVALRLAVSRPRKNGEDRGADFVDVTVFGPQAESCNKYLTKGRKIAVEGHLHHSEWESDTGRRQKLEVVARRVEFLGAPANPTDDHDQRDGAAVPVGVGAGEDPPDIPF